MAEDKDKPVVQLPPEVEKTIVMFTALYERFRELNKKTMGDWMERLAYLLAGMGILGWLIQTVQWLILAQQMGVVP